MVKAPNAPHSSQAMFASADGGELAGAPDLGLSFMKA
jgi:hypothetical protein